MKTTIKLHKCAKSLLGGLSAMVIILPASAIENPVSENAPKAKENKAAVAEPRKKEVKKVAMIGLGGNPASETLSLHLGLEPGQGLTIFHVVPGSPAAKAGLETHDVITDFQGKKMGSQQDLRAAVYAQKPGDEVTVKYIHKGKSEEKKIILGERALLPRARPMRGFKFRGGALGNFPDADRKRIQKMMDDNMKQLGENPNGRGVPLADFQRLLKGMQGGQAAPKPRKNGRMFNFFGGASVTLMDKEGSVTMKTTDGKKEVIVKDKSGKVLFEGPYQTAQDKAAVPDDIRGRLDRLDSVKVIPRGRGQGRVPAPAPLPDEAAE